MPNALLRLKLCALCAALLLLAHASCATEPQVGVKAPSIEHVIGPGRMPEIGAHELVLIVPNGGMPVRFLQCDDEVIHFRSGGPIGFIGEQSFACGTSDGLEFDVRLVRESQNGLEDVRMFRKKNDHESEFEAIVVLERTPWPTSFVVYYYDVDWSTMTAEWTVANAGKIAAK